MGQTIIEKIIASHSRYESVKPGEIVDIVIDARVARDFGGANVVKNLKDNNLIVDDPTKTFFTFDCNPGGSDQKYAANQHTCRLYARKNGIHVYDINSGIGTHVAIDKGLVRPGGTFVSTDSHANILGAIGAFGQGMGDRDIAAAWANGSVWFKVPETVKIHLSGKRADNLSAKDIVLNLLNIFGANKLLGYAVEVTGGPAENLSLDERITISSMATEMGAIIIFFTPNQKILNELKEKSGKDFGVISSDPGARFAQVHNIDISRFSPMVANPGHPEDDVELEQVKGTKIDSAFIGSCTNGRIEDLRVAAMILKDNQVAPGVVLKIVPATDTIWKQALEEGIIEIFKEAGALVSNAGCAGCAAGQVGQNGPDEVTISTGNRNFAGKQGKGLVYLASPATVAASAVAGYITGSDDIPVTPAEFDISFPVLPPADTNRDARKKENKPTIMEGRVWFINKDNIDTDMIFHNRYLTITDVLEMGQYTFDNLENYEDFAVKASPGDIIVTTKNFGAGSSRQQAVDCFRSLGIQCILAESFGAIYERNAINAAFPILTYPEGLIEKIELEDGDRLKVDFKNGTVTNLRNNLEGEINKFFDVQMEIYQKGGLLV
jgi:homoaconitate hydratase family protein/3-isopropylmalate dehydratase small subunit